MMLIRLNIFGTKYISLILFSIMFLCLSCSVLTNDVDDKSDIAGDSKNIPNIKLVGEENSKDNSPQKSSVKDILTGYSSEFTITSVLCDDELGPNCTKLRLGDDYLTTSFPAKGYLYSCTGKNPNAPGSIENKITWIDFTNGTWNFLKKLWLPKGTFNPEPGTYTETLSGDNRQINANNLPVDGKIGDWPMTSYPTLTEIDQNPGIPGLSNSSFIYSANPSEASFPTCVSLGAIGVTKNGVVIYHAADGRGEDAVAREIVDVFGGHPAGSDYHYHFIPERLDNESLSDGHSGIVGYINDGFLIYGYKGNGGSEMSNDDLDLCHGHKHGALGYHYHATLEYPYTVGCYMGTPISSLSNGGPQPGDQGGTPPPQAHNAGADLANAASILGVAEDALRDALGPPPPDVTIAAERLGIPEQALMEALRLGQ